MKTRANKKGVVQDMRMIRNQINTEIIDMTFEQERAYLDALLENKSVQKAYSIEEIRKNYKQAYSPWTKADDDRLEMFFCEGKTQQEIAAIFERNTGAISSRIKKLELAEKYGTPSVR